MNPIYPIALIAAGALVAVLTERSAKRERVNPLAAALAKIIGRGVAGVLFVAGLVLALAT